ncbi:VOC family protein [Salinimicrobium flavum]|uniref:VOC family protein n=1 Tax=Salinimicrobium flavum TaxID=1737065 RepID=A0ABW5IZU9_9FLAO
MFQSERIFSSFSVNDISEAEDFYTKILGLNAKRNAMGVLVLEISDHHKILIYLRAAHRPADFTVLNLPVANIEKAVDTLVQKGIRFEHEGEIETNFKGIFRTATGKGLAWFRDPAGNIISLLEE